MLTSNYSFSEADNQIIDLIKWLLLLNKLQIHPTNSINHRKCGVVVRSRRMHRRWQTTAALRMRLVALAWNMKMDAI